MRRLALLIFCLLTSALLSSAAPLADLGEAERLYREGNYSQAADIYQSFLRQGLGGGELYYNLGNCYYKTGQYGLAILNYERAERFLGDDSDLLTNHSLANLKVPDKIEPLPRWFVLSMTDGIQGMFSVEGWARLFILSEWILAGCVIGLISWRGMTKRRWITRLFWASATIFLLSGIFLFSGQYIQSRTVEGVVLSSSVEIHSAPDANSTELFTLHEGAKIRVLRKLPGWAEIHLADGKQGWVPQEAFEII